MEELRELKNKVLREVERMSDEIIRLCSDLVKIPSENPPGDMREIAGFASDWLSDRGFSPEKHEAEKGAVNVLVRAGDGRPCLILNGHMDVVPAGDRSRWSFDPYSGEVRDGKVLGRGATDMKGGLACIMSALVACSKALEELPGSVLLSLVPDEETGGQKGTKWLVEKGLLKGDACIIGEPSSIYASLVGEKGVCWLRLTARGRPAHGSLPMLGVNAIEKVVEAMSVLKELASLEARLPEDISEVITGSKLVLRTMLSQMGVPDRLLEGAMEAIDHITVNFGIIRGGVKVNVVPDSCVLEVDMRIPAGLTPQEVKAKVDEMLEEAGLKEIECELVQASEPNYTPPSERVFKLLDANAREIVGMGLVPFFMTGASDARFLRAAGIPTVHYGPGELHTAHAYDEYVRTDHLIIATKVIACTIIDFLGGA
ncbi:succinyl-diaminopimelate desuccinylase [Candidatus Bathyarchaeota archaeon ex4484_135]|nr:MAG: succinyl-diaminopimelate desuccinylase [Candidatus Bathyarchaeota archaeon ex4484_135]